MKHLRQCFAFLMILCFSQVIFAATDGTDPVPLSQLKKVSQDMIQMLHKNKSRIRHDNDFLEQEVKKIVLPQFALNNMSRAVVGRNAWIKATDEQKKSFKKEFTTLVLQIYSAPLATFDDDDIKFFPLRKKNPNAKSMVIRSVIVRKSGQRIPVTYNMIQVNDHWFVKDFSIEGISMIESYRSQFADTLSQSGFVGLLKQIKEHNKKNA